MSKTYTVRVGWRDIWRGDQYGSVEGKGGGCPVTLAIRRATGAAWASSGPTYIAIRGTDASTIHHIPAPDIVIAFIDAFDDIDWRWTRLFYLRPFTFQLTIP